MGQQRVDSQDTTNPDPTNKPVAFYCTCGQPLLSLGVVRCTDCGKVWATSLMLIGEHP